MNPENSNSNLPASLSWVYAVLAGIFAAFVLFLVDELLRNTTAASADISLICYALVAAGACYFICRFNPHSLWYAPIVCNGAGIMSACIEPTFWRTPMWMVVGAGWVVSVLAALAGAARGRHADHVAHPPAPTPASFAH